MSAKNNPMADNVKLAVAVAEYRRMCLSAAHKSLTAQPGAQHVTAGTSSTHGQQVSLPL